MGCATLPIRISVFSSPFRSACYANVHCTLMTCIPVLSPHPHARPQNTDPAPKPAPPAPPAPPPKGQRVQFMAVPPSPSPAHAVCLTSDGSEVVVGSCGSGVLLTSEWVQVLFDSRNSDAGQAVVRKQQSEYANAVYGNMCMNIYGGTRGGCKAGANIHLNECRGSATGNFFAYSNDTNQIASTAAGNCGTFCISADPTGTKAVLAPCADATRWHQVLL